MEINVSEVPKESFGAMTGKGSWDRTGISAFASELATKYKGKCVSMPLETVTSKEGKEIKGFYNQYYKGLNRIKYINYYCRKNLMEAFEVLGLKALVKTNKTNILIQL